jgi:gluconate 2-dehydrogenase gamma chain
MYRPRTLKRRKFLKVAAAAAASGSVISCSRAKGPWRFFTDGEAKTVAAICDRIIPEDQDPGATRTGVVNYIDRQLMLYFKNFQDLYRNSISAIEKTAGKLHGKGFTSLTAAQQTELLVLLENNKAPDDIWRNIPQREFFSLVVDHTMQGFYGNPRHGGNRDAASWKMLGVPEPPIRGRLQYELPVKT